MLLGADASINCKNDFGQTILHQAADDSDNEMIQYICEKTGINVFETNSKFKNAVMICQSKSNLEGLKILQKYDNSQKFVDELMHDEDNLKSKKKSKKAKKPKKSKMKGYE